MKLVLPTVGMIGVLAFWSWGLPPIPEDTLAHVTQRPDLRMLESDDGPDGNISVISPGLQKSEEQREASEGRRRNHVTP